jgi:hypothetical protein
MLLDPYTCGLTVQLGVPSAGAVLSNLIVTVVEAVPPALVAVHIIVVPKVSLSTVTGSQPIWLVIDDSLSVTVHDKLTGDLYQPFSPSGISGIKIGVIVGGVSSEITPVSDLNISAAKPLASFAIKFVALQTWAK